MKAGKILVLGLVMSCAAGCGPAGFEAENTDLILEKPGKVGDNDDQPSEKVCVVDTTDFSLNLHVQSFEMVDRIKGSVGFDFAKGILGSIGISADIESGRLETKMDLLRPMDLEQPIGEELQQTKKTKADFGFKLDAAKWKLEAGYIYNTPIGKLSSESLKKNFEKLMKTAKEEGKIHKWQARVIKLIDDQYIKISSGSNSGLKEGDLLDVTNAVDSWDGVPCESTYNGPIPASRMAGQYQVLNLNAETAVLKLVNEQYRVELGAVAVLSPTKEQKNRVMKRSVKLNQVTSRKIVIEGLGTVDMLDHMLVQIGPVLRDQGYYVKQK